MISYLRDFVELRTKVASVFPFLYTLIIYTYLYNVDQLDIKITVLFFLSMICLDMATTAINHLAGFTNEKDISPYDQKLLDEAKKLGLSRKFNLMIVAVLVATGVGLGIAIVVLTNIYVLIIGAGCTLVALLYSYGPIPLKNTFLGEVASGITLGALVPLAFVFSQNSTIFIESFTVKQLILNVEGILTWAVILTIPVLVVANIMLANNICDMKKDKRDGRVTLPLMIGTGNSKLLWLIGYLLCYIFIIALVALKFLPLISLVAILTLPLVLNNCRKFIKKSVKQLTFKYAVFNLQIILFAIILSGLIGLI